MLQKPIFLTFAPERLSAVSQADFDRRVKALWRGYNSENVNIGNTFLLLRATIINLKKLLRSKIKKDVDLCEFLMSEGR